MLFSFLSGGDIRTALISLLLTIPTVLIALSFHEAAHAFIAYKMGDRTAYNLGRVTLNPAKHLDLKGSLCMLFVGYGWAKPVPIHARNFKNPKYGMAWTALAGPVTNLILGIIGMILYTVTILVAQKAEVMLFLSPYAWYQITDNEMMYNIFYMTLTFFNNFAFLNFVFAIYNMIPVPPFDGSRFFSLFLPPKWYFGIMRYENYTMIAVIGLSILCSYLFNFSPFGWLADKLMDLIAYPLFRLI